MYEQSLTLAKITGMLGEWRVMVSGWSMYVLYAGGKGENPQVDIAAEAGNLNAICNLGLL